MIPIGCAGIVREGRMEGWWICVREQDKPRGYLIIRSRAPEMLDTVVVDGLFPDQASLDQYFQEYATRVEWQK